MRAAFTVYTSFRQSGVIKWRRMGDTTEVRKHRSARWCAPTSSDDRKRNRLYLGWILCTDSIDVSPVKDIKGRRNKRMYYVQYTYIYRPTSRDDMAERWHFTSSDGGGGNAKLEIETFTADARRSTSKRRWRDESRPSVQSIHKLHLSISISLSVKDLSSSSSSKI